MSINMKTVRMAATALAAFAVTAANATPVAAGCRSSGTPRIDGRLDDKIWSEVPTITDFQRADRKNVERKTEAKILWTPTAIVFGFKAYIPRQLLKITPTPRDKSTTAIDCVEIMIDPAGDADNYKHFIVNAANSIYDRACEQGGFVGDEKWNGEFTSAVSVEADFWSCEIAIPYRTLGITGKTGRVWSINLCRESFGSPTSPRECSSIAGGAFNVAGNFRKIAVPTAVDLKPYMLDVAAPMASGGIVAGKYALKIVSRLQDFSGLQRELRTECAIAIPDSLPVRGETRSLLAPNDSIALEFSDLTLTKPGHYTGTLTVRDPKTNRILRRRDFPVAAEYAPIKITVRDPHYRNMIFATQQLDKVRFSAGFDLPPAQLHGEVTGGIRTPEGQIVTAQTKPAAAQVAFEFPAAPLPEGKLEIFVRIGKHETAVPLRKLARKAGEVWRGKDGNWYRDGKKFFINSAWNYPIDNYDDYNIILGVPEPGQKFLFYNPNPFLGFSKILKDLRQGRITAEVRDFYRKKIEMCLDDPRLFGHFLADEPDIYGFTAKSFEELAAFFADMDPWHPIVICPASSGLIDFSGAAELSGFHCYPRVARDKRMSHFDKIVILMDQAREYFAGKSIAPTITYVHQGFDYSDAGNADTRIPDYEEYRNQNLLALILGSQGLMHYNRGVANYPELYLGMPVLAREQRIVGNEAVIQPDAAATAAPGDPALRILAKHNENSGEYWVLACNTSYRSGIFHFDFAPFANRELQLLSENRTIQASDGRVRDTFTPFQVHVYTTDRRDFQLRTIAETNAAIAAVYAARRRENTGNLAYQEHEGDTVNITASSNENAIFRAENSLWHLADGICAGPVADTPRNGVGIVFWQDATPNTVPDWVVLEFKQPQSVGRVEIYPIGDSLRDYEIQLRQNEEFQTVAAVKNATGAKQTISFAAQKTDAVRVYVTATRGANCKLYEIKIFAE